MRIISQASKLSNETVIYISFKSTYTWNSQQKCKRS